VEEDECEWGWNDESFGFIECGGVPTETVNVPPGKPMGVCASHAEEIRSIWPELNG
jgi:hypothetical protein